MGKEYILLQDVILPRWTKFSRACNELWWEENIEAFFELWKDFTWTAIISLSWIEDADENIITKIL